MQEFDAIIVGGGPCGMTAAFALKRAGFSVCVFEREKVGGLLLHAGAVENYPGLAGARPGKEIVEIFKKKLDEYGVSPVFEEVTDWQQCKGKGGEFFRVVTVKGEYFSRVLIISTGTVPKVPEFFSDFFKVDKVTGRGVFCSDDIRVKKRIFINFLELTAESPSSVIIVGGGDAAFDYGLSLASRGWDVKILYRGRKPRAFPLLVRRAMERKGIRLVSSCLPLRCELTGCGVSLLCVDADGNQLCIEAERILSAIGRKPDDFLLKGLKKPETILCQVDSVAGMYVAGDLRHGFLRQTVIAAGDGMAAAMLSMKYLAEGR